MHRHRNLSIRTPENTSVARIKAYNKQNVNEFFNNYVNVIIKYKFKPNQIYNFDETAVNNILPLPEVVVPKGQKQITQATSAERGSM